MHDTIDFTSLNWSGANRTENRLLKQQLVFLLHWHLTVGVWIWKVVYVDFRISNYTWKYRSLYLWLTLNIRSQKSLVKFWFYGIEVSLNPIEVKVKPTFIVNKFSFIFIHIPWFRRFTFCILNCLASDIL